MIYRKVKTNLSRTLSSIEQDKATSDDYVKCILADPQIAAYIVQALVPEFKEMEAEKIIPCIGEPTVMLRFPERLGVKIQNVNNESVDEDDGKIIYDIKFPLYYNGKRREFIINIEAQKSSKKSKLGYRLENRIAYYMGRMISEQKGTEFVNSNYDDLKSVYTIWICMDTKKSEDSIIEFGMKSSLIYGKIKKIPQIDKLNGALINVRTRATKNKKQSKNKLIGMLEELFSKSEFIEKKKILEEDYGLKMSMELEGRMSEMCNVSDYWEEVATEEGKEIGKEIGERQKIISQVVKKLQKDKSVAEIADDLEEKEEVIAPIYEAALSMKPDYDVEKIYELLEKNKKLA
uniref:hypothetical protein n=2 Tax=Agathobacter rectalis TaxID=39491 RepID=UPI002804C6BA|nr:hypothetical protein [uncultured Agathobacter sp.]